MSSPTPSEPPSTPLTTYEFPDFSHAVRVTSKGLFSVDSVKANELIMIEPPAVHKPTVEELVERVIDDLDTLPAVVEFMQHYIEEDDKDISSYASGLLQQRDLDYLDGKDPMFAKVFCYVKRMMTFITPLEISNLTPPCKRTFEGMGLFPAFSFIRHQCCGNATYVFSPVGRELHLIACRDIQEGEEITVNIFGFNLFTCGYTMHLNELMHDLSDTLRKTTHLNDTMSSTFLRDIHMFPCNCDCCVGYPSPLLEQLRYNRIGDINNFKVRMAVHQWFVERHRVWSTSQHKDCTPETVASEQYALFHGRSLPLLTQLAHHKLVFWWVYVALDIVEALLQCSPSVQKLGKRFCKLVLYLKYATLLHDQPSNDPFVLQLRELAQNICPDVGRQMFLAVFQLQREFPTMIDTKDITQYINNHSFPKLFLDIHVLLFQQIRMVSSIDDQSMTKWGVGQTITSTS